jgi:hypothetical protein
LPLLQKVHETLFVCQLALCRHHTEAVLDNDWRPVKLDILSQRFEIAVVHHDAPVRITGPDRLVTPVQPDIISPPIELPIQEIGVIDDKGLIAVPWGQIPFFKNTRKKVNPFRGLSVSGFFLLSGNFACGTGKLMFKVKAVVVLVDHDTLGILFHEYGIDWAIFRAEADERIGNESRLRRMLLRNPCGKDHREKREEQQTLANQDLYDVGNS